MLEIIVAPKAAQTPSATFVNREGAYKSLRQRFDVDIREFMVLAVIYEAGGANARSLASALELSSSTVDYCISRLAGNGLINAGAGLAGDFSASTDGIKLVREAHRNLGWQPVETNVEVVAVECAA